jgi:hypothetical protein
MAIKNSKVLLSRFAAAAVGCCCPPPAAAGLFRLWSRGTTKKGYCVSFFKPLINKGTMTGNQTF